MIMFNTCEKLECSRCSATFYVFLAEPAFDEQLCCGCWTELQYGIESIDMPASPNVNDMATYQSVDEDKPRPAIAEVPKN